MTLKNEVKVKFDIWFGGFGYMFGVVYYSMLWPKTNISGRNSQGHPLYQSHCTKTAASPKLIMQSPILCVAAMDNTLELLLT